MKQDTVKKLLGFTVGAIAGITIAKIIKENKINLVLNQDFIDSLLPKKEIVINPNGEDLTVKPEMLIKQTEEGLLLEGEIVRMDEKQNI